MNPIEIIVRLPKRLRYWTAQQIIGRCAAQVAERAHAAGLRGHVVLRGMGGRRYRVYWKAGDTAMSEPTKLAPGGGHYVSKEMLGDHPATIIRDCETGQIADAGTWRTVIEKRIEQLQADIDERDDGDGEPDAASRELAAERRALKWALAMQAAPVKTLQHISV